MSTLHSLFLLLVVAYLGSFLMGGRGLKGRGLPSGSEWLVVGIVLGPSALALLGSMDLDAFMPIALIATGWIALLVGLTFGVDGERRIPISGLLIGLASGAITLAAVAGTVLGVLQLVPAAGELFPLQDDRIRLALGVGAALSDTSRNVAAWAARRLGARGPLLDRVSDVTRSDDLVAVAVMSYLVSADSGRGVLALPGVGAAIGGALGLACAGLLGRSFRATTFWALLFGFSLLATGTSEQLDVAVISTGFVFGLVLAVASPLREQARELAISVEGAVVLPALLLAGAHSTLPGSGTAWIVLAVLITRILASLVTAGLVALTSPTARRGGPALALAFSSPGPLGIAVALALGLRTPGPAADVILGAAVAASLLGEFLGPPSLRRALRNAGELPAAVPPETPAVEIPVAEEPA